MQNTRQEPADLIPVEIAGTLDGLLSERVRRSPQATAYRDYDRVGGKWRNLTWAQMDEGIQRWQTALARENLAQGDRVAIMLRNCPEWVMFEQAALRLGLVVVPLYTADRPENAAYILRNAGVRILLLEELAQWQTFCDVHDQLTELMRVVTVQASIEKCDDGRVSVLHDWLPEKAEEQPPFTRDPHQMATIIYTSGTSGRPKGVMLSHYNILTNAHGSSLVVPLSRDDLFLSFLPLSHTFERTAGYYVPMMCGAAVAYARSIQQLQEDLLIVRPTILVSVPRIYERVYSGIRAKLAEGPALNRKLFKLAVDIGYSRFEHQQGRIPGKISHLLWPILENLVAKKVMSRLGGRLRGAMSGGAALPAEAARVFIGLGLPVLQGYGMTESSPVVCSNTFEDNVPSSVGRPIAGVEVKLGENDALLIRGPNVMLGYWNDPEATRAVLSPDGWLNSGDIARIDEGRITITGRLKEIIVMSTGEKVPPADMEAAILRDALFEQAMLIGEGRSYLSVLVVLNPSQWETLATQHNLDRNWHHLREDPRLEEILLARIVAQIREFPGYAKIYRVALATEPWTIENGLLTPTLKLRRGQVLERYKTEAARLYEGH
ncbi:MAG: AMP-dependent synthetase and ligase [Nitrosospira sp.]